MTPGQVFERLERICEFIDIGLKSQTESPRGAVTRTALRLARGEALLLKEEATLREMLR